MSEFNEMVWFIRDGIWIKAPITVKCVNKKCVIQQLKARHFKFTMDSVLQTVNEHCVRYGDILSLEEANSCDDVFIVDKDGNLEQLRVYKGRCMIPAEYVKELGDDYWDLIAGIPLRKHRDPYPRGRIYENRSMVELRALAKKREIKVPFGVSKEQLIKLL